MTDTNALIAEARDEARYQEKHGGDKHMAKLLNDLADTLETACIRLREFMVED